MRISEVCKERKKQLKMSNQEIADRSEVLISTVNKFMSVGSKSPSVYTVGPICRALGISLDGYFGIQTSDMNDAEKQRIAEAFEKHRQEAKKYQEESQRIIELNAQQAEHQQQLLKIADDRLKLMRISLCVLGGVCILILIYAMVIDALSQSIGLIRY